MNALYMSLQIRFQTERYLTCVALKLSRMLVHHLHVLFENPFAAK